MVEEARAIARWIASSMPVGEADLKAPLALVSMECRRRGGADELDDLVDMVGHGSAPSLCSLPRPTSPDTGEGFRVAPAPFPSGVVPPDPNLLPLGERESARVLAAASR